MSQRGTDATFLWCSYAAITRVMAALVIQLGGMHSISSPLLDELVPTLGAEEH